MEMIASLNRSYTDLDRLAPPDRSAPQYMLLQQDRAAPQDRPLPSLAATAALVVSHLGRLVGTAAAPQCSSWRISLILSLKACSAGCPRRGKPGTRRSDFVGCRLSPPTLTW